MSYISSSINRKSERYQKRKKTVADYSYCGVACGCFVAVYAPHPPQNKQRYNRNRLYRSVSAKSCMCCVRCSVAVYAPPPSHPTHSYKESGNRNRLNRSVSAKSCMCCVWCSVAVYAPPPSHPTHSYKESGNRNDIKLRLRFTLYRVKHNLCKMLRELE